MSEARIETTSRPRPPPSAVAYELEPDLLSGTCPERAAPRTARHLPPPTTGYARGGRLHPDHPLARQLEPRQPDPCRSHRRARARSRPAPISAAEMRPRAISSAEPISAAASRSSESASAIHSLARLGTASAELRWSTVGRSGACGTSCSKGRRSGVYSGTHRAEQPGKASARRAAARRWQHPAHVVRHPFGDAARALPVSVERHRSE